MMSAGRICVGLMLFVASIFSGCMSTPDVVDFPAVGLAVSGLRCEFRVNPLGIDAAEPRLSWIVESKERGQVQTAYRVLAASSEALLAGNNGDLWDSGKVFSDETTGIAYQGSPLSSYGQCFWKVQAWDREGRASLWSEPAFWTMGMLSPEDRQGEWIGHDELQRQVIDEKCMLTESQWIGAASSDGDTADPGMNSHNHVMLVGDLMIWLNEYLAGIRPDPADIGFRKIIIKPYVVGDLSFVEASYESVRGEIRSAWRKDRDRFELDVTIPANTTATVYIPASDMNNITESGIPVEKAQAVSFEKFENSYAVFHAGSGSYRFVSKGYQP